MKVLATMILSLALIGCGVTPHEVSVDFADRSAYTSATVVGIPIHVTVVDDRDSELVGQRNTIGAKIKATNLLSQLRIAVKELFEAKGYRLVTESQASTVVSVKLRGASFEYTMGFLTGGQHVSVTLGVRARKGKNGWSEYEKIYRSQAEKRRFVVAYGEEIDQRLSNHMNAVLRQIATDEALHAFLTEEGQHSL